MDRIEYLQKLQGYKPDLIPDNELKKYRIEHGLSQKEFGELFGVNVNLLCKTEIGMISPVCNGRWKEWVLKAADFFRVLPEDIFPREVCKLDGYNEELEFVPLNDAINVEFEADYDIKLDVNSLWGIIEAELTPREFAVLKYRILDERTLKETSSLMGFSKQAASIAESRALRKLRRSRVSVHLRPFYEAQ